jgi:L-lactate dehydrogenase
MLPGRSVEEAMKVGVIGAGQVGAACVLSLVLRGSAREIVLVNRNRKRADGVITDVQYGAVLSPIVNLRSGDYADLAGAALVMITAGVNEKGGGATDRSDPAGRLRLLEKNADVYRQIVPEIHRAAPDALVLVVTDPPDPLADIVRLLGHERVLSTGTYLDTLRFRFHIARKLNLDPAAVDALVLGEHGTSSVFLWSSGRIGGKPLLDLLDDKTREEIEREVRYANITIIEGIGASQYGIGMVCANIAEIILWNKRTVIPIGAYQSKFGITLSLPSIVGAGGVVQVLDPEMSSAERQGLERSAQKIKDALDRINLKSPPGRTA